MSYTTIKAIWPGEKHEDLQELKNSHGSAPVIWAALCEKYYGTKNYMMPGILDRLWPRWKNLSIPEHHRSVLMMTYDRAYVVKKDYARAAKDIRNFLTEFLLDRDYINHWPTIAKLYESDPDIPAIGLYCTSLSEDPFEGPWNEEKEEYEQPDWSKCYDLYAELDSLNSHN